MTLKIKPILIKKRVQYFDLYLYNLYVNIGKQGECMSEVLALKYRPSNFEKLIGQDAITQTLTLALSNKRLSHAYLFSGLRGSGKTSTARIFSKALVCDHGPTATPCETCENCVMANENRHIDIIEMDAASSRKIDDIRDVIEQTKYKPTIARFKIFIIDEVHMLTREAFNALLKTLEEPPEFVKFILATTDPLKLPATILSRTQHFRFKQIAKNDIAHHLSHILNQENVSYELDALEMISRAGNGSLRDSLTLLDQAIIFTKGHITPQDVASMLGLLDSAKLEEIFEAIFNEDEEKILAFINELEAYECEVVLDELISYVKEKFYKRDSRFSMLISERFFRILSEAKQLLFINADSGFVLGLVFFKMKEAMNIKRIDTLINSLEEEKFRQNDTSKQINSQPTQTPQPQTKEPVAPSMQEDTASQYESLVAKLYDRNYELGECFKKSITYIGFEDNVLSLQSAADETCKKTLRNASGVIKHFVKDIFGLNATISMKQASKPPAPMPLQEPPKEKIEPPKEQQTQGEKQKEPEKKLDPQEILNEPLLQKAQELFKPTKIQIKPK